MKPEASIAAVFAVFCCTEAFAGSDAGVAPPPATKSVATSTVASAEDLELARHLELLENLELLEHWELLSVMPALEEDDE